MIASESIYTGIDIGATNIKYLFMKESGEKLKSGSVLTAVDRYDALLIQVGDIARNPAEDLKRRIKGIGVLFAGFIDFIDGKIISSPNLRILDGHSIWKDLKTAFAPLPFTVDNDANGAAYGEYAVRRIQQPDLSHLIFLTLGSGVGGGVIVDGRLLHGSRGYAAELGHIKIYETGRPCGCGSNGCAESYISNIGIIKTFKEELKKNSLQTSDADFDPDKLTAEKISELAGSGFPPAVSTMGITGRLLGLLVSILINTFNPQIIALGGGIMKSADLLLPAACREAESKSIPCSFKAARIEKAVLGPEAGAYGAAMLARDLLR